MSKRGTTFVHLDLNEAIVARYALAMFVKHGAGKEEFGQITGIAKQMLSRIDRRLRTDHPDLADEVRK